MGACRCLLCLGLASSLALSHDPPHALERAPGEQAVAIGKAAVVRSSTSGLRHYKLNADPGAYGVTGYPATLQHSTGT
jgi:hypothetical protein